MPDRTDNSMLADNSAKKLILIADDENTNRVLLSKAFSGDFKVLETEDGFKTLALLRERCDEIAAVILDFVLPGIDGLEVIRCMRNDKALENIPAIVVTDWGNEKNQIAALEAGALDVISKPFNPKVVLHRVSNIISRVEADRLAEQNRIYAEQLRKNDIDEKSGIYNKAAFCRKATKFLQQNPERKYVLCRWDIDRFKVYNDIYGMAQGDKLLRHIGSRFREEFGNGIDIYGHLEADHFVFCHEYGRFSDSYITEKLESFVSGINPDFEFVPRVGIYLIKDNTVDVSLMCDRALLALRSIKGNYSERCAWYDNSMRSSLLEEQALVSEMKPALTSGQFEVYYQPQYNYADRTLYGAEALVRWNHPVKGMIPPDKFITVFEHNGFISRLDEYVWEQVCISLRKWIDAGIKVVPVSVNISRIDIYNQKLCRILTELVKKYDLDISLLRLEITETAYMENVAQLIKVVNLLRKIGFSVEMDDFGSGYSSLNSLKEVEVDLLKMDMKFLENAADESRSGSILSSVVRLAHWLSLPVLAEGVETKKQADYLKSIGCFFMQGYYFAKPMNSADFEKILRESSICCDRQINNYHKAEGNVDFLDATTQATLLFNSFVGGAQIIEFDGNNIEMIRSNDRFFEVVCSNRTDYVKKQIHLLDRFYPESQRVFVDALNKASETGEEIQCELHSLPSDGSDKDFWTLNRIRFLARSDERRLYYISVENITRSKELENTRKRLNDIVRNVPEGVAICKWTEKLVPVYMSEKTRIIFGLTSDEYNRHIDENAPAEFIPDIDYLPEEQISKLRAGKPLEVTVPAKRTDGSWFWLHINANLAEAESDNTEPLIYATVQDVSDQHYKDESFTTLMEFMPGGLFRYTADKDEHISYISSGMLKMLGYTREEFSEKFDDRFSLMVYEEDRERVLAEINEQIAADSDHHDFCEYRIEAADGSLKWVYDVGYLAEEADGKKLFYVIILDIDDRKRLENKLLDEVRSSSALIANAPGGVEIFKVTGKDLSREYISDGVAKLYKLPEDTDIDSYFGSDVYSHIHPDDVERVKSEALMSIEKSSVFRCNYRIRRYDGSYLWVRLSGNPVIDSDGVYKVYCTYSDISAQMHFDERMKLERSKTVIALKAANLAVWEYNVADNSVSKLTSFYDSLLPETMSEAPQQLIKKGFVAPSSAKDFLSLYADIKAGCEKAVRDIMFKTDEDKFSLLRITYLTVFDNGIPVGAIGSSVDISAENNNRFMRRELDMLLSTSSLYFWIFDNISKTFPVVNDNAKRLGIGKIIKRKPAGIFDLGCVMPDSLEEIADIPKTPDGKYPRTDITVTLHLDQAITGVEWMKLSCSPVLDESGELLSIAAVGEDVSETVRNEKQLARALAKIEQSKTASIISDIHIDMESRIIESGKGTLARQGMKYSEFLKNLGEVIYTDAQKKEVMEFLSPEQIEKAHRCGEYSRSVQYQRFVHNESFPRWVRTTVRTFTEPITGRLKSFQFTADIDREISSRLIADSMLDNSYEYLGLIYIRNRYLHGYRCSALECTLKNGVDCDYSEAISAFAEKYVSEANRSEVCEAMSLENIVLQLRMKRIYSINYELNVGNCKYHKQWSFCWLDADKTTIVMMREDVSNIEQLRETNEGMRLALENSKTAVCYFDPAQRTLTVPEGYASIHGQPAVIKNVPASFTDIAAGDKKALAEFYAGITAGKTGGEIVVQFMKNDGTARFEHLRYTAQQKPKGKHRTTVITATDITAQRYQQIENERNRLVIETTGSCIFDYDVSSDTITYDTKIKDEGIVSRTIEKFYEVLPDSDIISPEFLPAFGKLYKQAKKSASSGSIEFISNIWKSGDRWSRMHYVSLADSSGRVYRIIGQVSDIQNEKDKVSRYKGLAESAVIDPLTELYNRRALEQKAEEALNSAISDSHYALFMIDLDNFKQVNDTLGHQQGDDTLTDAAQAIKSAFRKSDIVARLGGDEFMVFMEFDGNISSVEKKADRLIRAMRFGAGNLSVTASVGITIANGSGTSFSDLYEQADAAMYAAKESGKDHYHFFGKD